jgi:hypothetical protein
MTNTNLESLIVESLPINYIAKAREINARATETLRKIDVLASMENVQRRMAKFTRRDGSFDRESFIATWKEIKEHVAMVTETVTAVSAKEQIGQIKLVLDDVLKDLES